MTTKERYKKVLAYFESQNPVAQTELLYHSPYELAVAVILSAQCTDKRVNIITPPFFERLPDFQTLAASSEEEIFELIRTCSYPNNKARNLLGMARMVTHTFGGILPADIKQLEQIPGIGRKTANVLASVLYDMPVIAVDTHVFRVSARIGLTRNAKTPLETEKQLEKHIPIAKRAIAHHWLILHGRYVCIARKPKCEVCGISEFCGYFGGGRG